MPFAAVTSVFRLYRLSRYLDTFVCVRMETSHGTRSELFDT